jgi:hypothetical protein
LAEPVLPYPQRVDLVDLQSGQRYRFTVARGSNRQVIEGTFREFATSASGETLYVVLDEESTTWARPALPAGSVAGIEEM